MITSGYILGTSTLMDNRDVGLYAPIKDLPGCNPIWTKDMPNVKPTCNTKEPEPPYVSPNAVFENLKVSRLSHPILTYSTSQTSLSHFLRRSTALRASLGEKGASRLSVWGSGGSGADIKVGTAAEILAGYSASAGAPSKSYISAKNTI